MGGYDQAFMDVMNSKLAQDIMNAYDQGAKDKEAEVIKLLEVLWQKTQGTDIPAVVVLPEAIALIKEEK